MHELRRKIPEHEFVYLGDGLQDIDIERFMIKNKDAVLVTGDVEFDTHFGWERSLLVGLDDSIKDKILLIKAWASK